MPILMFQDYLSLFLMRVYTVLTVVARTGSASPDAGFGVEVSFLGFFASLLDFC